MDKVMFAVRAYYEEKLSEALRALSVKTLIAMYLDYKTLPGFTREAQLVLNVIVRKGGADELGESLKYSPGVIDD